MALQPELWLTAAFVTFVLILGLSLALTCKVVYGAKNSPFALGSLPVLYVVVYNILFVAGPLFMENTVSHARAPLPERYQILRRELPIPPSFEAADLHSDALMWMRRDLLARSSVGHVDLPRLEEGKFSLQVFAMVISAPRGMNVKSNARPQSLFADHVFPKMLLERWPVRAWRSHLQRALVQCKRLEDLSDRSGGRLSVARTVADLDKPGVKGILALEGATSLEHNLHNLVVLYRAGLRILGPAHFFDTEVGGSLSGVKKRGLTPFGRQVVQKMKDLDMILDLAHSSEAVFEDIRSIPDIDRPCAFLSHTGVRAVCDSPRNYDDKYLRLVAEMNGIIGIALFHPALCQEEDLVASWVESVVHAIAVVGIDHVALGSDFDGSVITSVHAGQMDILFAALVRDGGLSVDDAMSVLGRNSIAFFRRCLPKETLH